MVTALHEANEALIHFSENPFTCKKFCFHLVTIRAKDDEVSCIVSQSSIKYFQLRLNDTISLLELEIAFWVKIFLIKY